MPGVLEWQRRQLSRRDLRAVALGIEPAYRDLDPAARAVSAAADREMRQLRPAREADAERIRWLESALTQAASDLSGSGEQRASLAGRVSRQEEIIRQQTALVGQRNAEIERHQAAATELKAEIARKDAEARKFQDTVGKLESEARRRSGEAERKSEAIRRQDAMIGKLEARVRQLRQRAWGAVAAREAEPPAGHHERTADRQAARLTDLETGHRYLRDRLGQLEAENERLRARLAKRATAPTRRGGARA